MSTGNSGASHEDVSLGEVSGGVIEALSTGLYDNIRDVIREYVQNSYDAIRAQYGKRKSGGVIRISVDKRRNTVTIADNGCGMNRESLIQGINIGYSSKGREDVGFRGIGMLAGWALAEKIVVLTKPSASAGCWKAEIRAKEILQEIESAKNQRENLSVRDIFNKYVSVSEERVTKLPTFPEGHGTLVVLEKIGESHADLLREDSIMEHLSKVAPVAFLPRDDFDHSTAITRQVMEQVDYFSPVRIEVNGTQVFKPYRNEDVTEDPSFKLICSRDGKKLAFIWYLIRNRSSRNPETRGLRLFLKGFRIGDEDYVQNQLVTFKPANLSYWVLGEVYVVSEGVMPTSDRNRLKDNDARSTLRRYLGEFGSTLEKEVRDRSERNTALKDSEEARVRARKAVRMTTTEDLTLTEAAEIVKDVKESRKKVESHLKALERKGDLATIELSGMRKTIKDCQKAEKSLIECADNDEDVLKLGHQMAKTYRILKRVVNRFPFDEYAGSRSGSVSKIRADLMTALGRALAALGDD